VKQAEIFPRLTFLVNEENCIEDFIERYCQS